MVTITPNNFNNNNNKIDFSFIPSLKCNLFCSFCMYNAGPNNDIILDYYKTKNFINSWDWSFINSVGFYGGEPSIDLPLYQKFIDLVPERINKWIITNGTWSTDENKISEFLNFINKNNMFVVVSGTNEHKKHQSRKVLKYMQDETGAFKLKGSDILYPMGRNYNKNWKCDGWCQRHSQIMRLAIHPNGNIIYQNCHGIYPCVQTYKESFNKIYERSLKVAEKCFNEKFINLKKEKKDEQR